MVLAWGEFGRTPQLNAKNGRDHWPGVFSAALAGGGIQGGRVVGSSDAKGAYPKENAKAPRTSSPRSIITWEWTSTRSIRTFRAGRIPCFPSASGLRSCLR